MAGELRSFFCADLVARLAADIARVHWRFPVDAFVRDATNGLDELELLDRGRLIAAALARHLPRSYPDAVDVLVRSLGPEHASDELIGAGMGPFFYFPHLEFVATHGLGHFDLSLDAQYELTKRFSAESSIRAFLAHDPERTFARLRTWSADGNPHVRRLVSEGTRLRLPWAPRVAWLDAHPERVIELLELLRDDPTTLVRRSVANNLNDLGRVHPELLVATCGAWLRGASAERRALLDHALRGAVKRGDAGALELLGFGARPRVVVEDVRLRPRRVSIGGQVEIAFDLVSTARTRQSLLVDLRVHFVKANGRTSPKVFKLARVDLAPRARHAFATKVSLAVHTTRRPYPGRHEVEVLANGSALPVGGFQVSAPRRATEA